MPYNISTWKTKELKDLVIPIAALTQFNADMTQRGWRELPIRLHSSLALTIRPVESGEIVGTGVFFDEPISKKTYGLKELIVSKICLCGEGSGTYYEEMLLPALKQSKGKLHAILIWEGGDSITKLLVEDGQVTETSIEL